MAKSSAKLKGYVFAPFFISLLLVALTSAQEVIKPAVESFESEAILAQYEHGADTHLKITKDRRQFGKSALEWEWKGKDNKITTTNFRTLDRNPDMLIYEEVFPSSPTMVLSLYSEKTQQGRVKISYQKNGADAVWFYIPIDFTGWRTIRVPFFEMEGNPPKKSEGVAYEGFALNTDAKSGKLIIDDIVFSQYMDNRYPYPDLLVPFIKDNQEVRTDHWMPLISNWERLQNVAVPKLDVSEEKQLDTVQNRLNIDMKNKMGSTSFSEAKSKFEALQLSETKSLVVGPPLTYNSQEVFYDSLQQGVKRENDMKSFGNVLYVMAQAFHTAKSETDKEILKQDFLLASRYYLDQGWQKGASGGTRHHIGYATKELTKGFYLMRDELQVTGLLKDIGKSLQWLNNLGLVLDEETNFHVNIDYLNTQAYDHLITLFLSEEKEKQATLLKAYANYLSVILAQQEEEWGFKPDGTAWHHNGHYPAYGVGAFQTMPAIFKMLTGTDFRIAEAGHANFKKAFLATTEYSQLYDWGFGNAGRHPLESLKGNSIRSLQQPFLDLAYSGNPEGTSEIDSEIAGAYTRLWGKEDPLQRKQFSDRGVSEKSMLGYTTFPYAATSVHRRKEWAALIKGYSKYIWSSEIYAATNRYGRYPANGTVQLLNKGGEAGSGFVQEGWDWNRYPSATVVYLPLSELETKKSLLMFLSEETFAGAAQLGDNGVFGMVLNETKGLNADGLDSDRAHAFPEKLKAKKSVFSFGDKLICIGTDISSIDEKNPVQTNLFQSFLKTSDMPMHLSGNGKVIDFPFASSVGNWVVDPYGNGYHVLMGGNIQSKRENQKSYHNKYSLRTGSMHVSGKGAKETKGDFATAWLDHGVAPSNASYHYVIYPFLSEKEQASFGKKIAADTSYVVVRADGITHVVNDRESLTTGYVIFDAYTFEGGDYLKSVSDPSILMVQNQTDGSLQISAVQPDLNFKDNKTQKNGFDNWSRPVELTLTFKGEWEVEKADFILKRELVGGNTKITVTCVNGLSRAFKLVKS